MFTTTVLDLGVVKVGHKQEVKYFYKDIRSIDKTVASCDCTEIVVKPKEKVLIAEWTPSDIPQHLKLAGKNQYQVQKSITVSYTSFDKPDEQQVVVLLFNATVVS